LASAAICAKMGVLLIGTRAMVIENKVETLTITTSHLAKKVLCAATSPCHYISQNSITISFPDHSTSNNEYAFSSNIPDYVSTIPDNSPASSGKTYSNASIGKIPLEFSPFYNMKDIQAFYAKELPIPPPVILLPSLVLSQSPISDSQDFFPSKEISPKDTNTSVSPSSSVGSSSPIRIEQANKITLTELKRLLTNKYCPRTEIKKMKDEFYDLTIKGNDLKTYIRRFQQLALLGLNMVPNSEKLIEVFIGGLPTSIEGNVTALKPQTLEEVIIITQRLIKQVIKHQSTQEADDHK
nr:reverse transcriptase domain-containing protein [Tanacetum cinerariifolium]